MQTLILRAVAVLDLADALDEELARINSTSLLSGMELPVQRVLAGMENTGIAVDLDLLSELQSDFAHQIRDAAEAAYAVIGKQINLGSPKQLQAVLFDELQMPKTKRTKTGYTTDADALQSLFDKTGHPFLQHLWPTGTPPGSRSPSTGCSTRWPPTGASTPPSTKPSRRRADCRRPSRTCRTFRSAPRRAGGSATRSWSATVMPS